ncbi:2Fe-2S iron-sulfur cluster-binding protein, partial [Bacteroidota bacterium]
MILLATKFTIILISIAVFLLIILLLVSVLLYARKKLTPQGDVKFEVNDKEFLVSPGSTVLTTLSNQEIFLPSACGGGGTCAMCKCQVLDGGGSILPTETGFFTRKE